MHEMLLPFIFDMKTNSFQVTFINHNNFIDVIAKHVFPGMTDVYIYLEKIMVENIIFEKNQTQTLLSYHQMIK